MGKSQKIQDAAAKDKEFEAFLEQRQNELLPKVESYRKGFDENITKFYEKTSSEYITIAEGEKWEYHLSSEVGLGTLKTRVTEMVYSIFGVTASGQTGKTELEKTENGSITMELSDSIITVLKLISGYKVLAAAAACNFIFSALDLFGTKLEISDAHNYSSQPLVPGLTLHMDSYTNSYSNEKFLHTDKIVTTYVRFKLIYSYSLAQTITDLDCIVKLQDSISYQEASLVTIKKELANLIMTMTPATKDAVELQQMRYQMLKELCEENEKELEDLVNKHAAQKDTNTQNVLKATRALPIPSQSLEGLRMQMFGRMLRI